MIKLHVYGILKFTLGALAVTVAGVLCCRCGSRLPNTELTRLLPLLMGHTLTDLKDYRDPSRYPIFTNYN